METYYEAMRRRDEVRAWQTCGGCLFLILFCVGLAWVLVHLGPTS